MSFIAYDLFFLAIFGIALIIFLYVRRNKLEREGLLYLYKTNIGIKIIEKVSKKYSKILRPLQYVVIISGFVLMILMIWLLVKFSYIYVFSPSLAEDLKIPIVTPLVPYIDQLFAVDFLPPLYFTYWILIIALIAIPHEFAHGIFARLNKIKIHSTGFGFLGPFLAAFVEQDEKHMKKASKFAQMSVLAAGTFANVISAIVAGILMIVFILAFMTPAGVYFNTYSIAPINFSEISQVNGKSIYEFNLNLFENETLVNVTTADGNHYLSNPKDIDRAIQDKSLLFLFEDAPAIRSGLKGAITSIDGVQTISYEKLSEEIKKHSPGEEIKIMSIDKNGELTEYDIKLAGREGEAYLGIGVLPLQSSGIRGFIYKLFSGIKDPMIYYESRIGDLGIFLYDLLWWAIMVCISVALVNMLPMGIFDGGRFFYLTIWAITGKEKWGARAYKVSTWAILALVILMMIRWILIFF